MTKNIGTGKDPRAPEGVDFDIPDARPHEQALVEESGIGTPVPAGEEAYAVHRGYDTIAEEGGTPDVAGKSGEELARGGLAPGGIGDHADRGAARVETTSANPAGDAEDDSTGDGAGDGLSENLSRDELNSRAAAAGVEDPESLPNKGAVIDAIRAEESGAE